MTYACLNTACAVTFPLSRGTDSNEGNRSIVDGCTWGRHGLLARLRTPRGVGQTEDGTGCWPDWGRHRVLARLRTPRGVVQTQPQRAHFYGLIEWRCHSLVLNSISPVLFSIYTSWDSKYADVFRIITVHCLDHLVFNLLIATAHFFNFSI